MPLSNQRRTRPDQCCFLCSVRCPLGYSRLSTRSELYDVLSGHVAAMEPEHSSRLRAVQRRLCRSSATRRRMFLCMVFHGATNQVREFIGWNRRALRCYVEVLLHHLCASRVCRIETWVVSFLTRHCTDLFRLSTARGTRSCQRQVGDLFCEEEEERSLRSLGLLRIRGADCLIMTECCELGWIPDNPGCPDSLVNLAQERSTASAARS